MLRTHSRPLVKGLCSKQFALCSSLCLGIAGTTILSKYVNLLSAQLAFSNIFIYSFLYTPLKRLSIFNTDVGALVGAIVPLIGWSSASCIPNISSDLLDGKCLILPLILFSWQFLHFYPLSHLIGQDYLRAGYKMAILQRPLFCRISCFAHSCLIAAICHLSASKFDFVTPKCALYCLAPINILAIGLSSKYLLNGCIGNARILFRFSLVHLPYILSVYLLKNCPYLHKSLTDTESYFKKAFGII
ncbi:MAG: Protoheme IX farnesyltransferase, mitochondrial [Marteilia pararefringens]